MSWIHKFLFSFRLCCPLSMQSHHKMIRIYAVIVQKPTLHRAVVLKPIHEVPLTLNILYLSTKTSKQVEFISLFPSLSGDKAEEGREGMEGIKWLCYTCQDPAPAREQLHLKSQQSCQNSERVYKRQDAVNKTS